MGLNRNVQFYNKMCRIWNKNIIFYNRMQNIIFQNIHCKISVQNIIFYKAQGSDSDKCNKEVFNY